MCNIFSLPKSKGNENKEYEAIRKSKFKLKTTPFGYTHVHLMLHVDEWGSSMLSTLACVCRCMCEHQGASQCVQQQPQGFLLPPTHHNKEQLNAAALPAEEPTASHTSTNTQICLKPKGRSNKSQPTRSNPLQNPSADANQKVTGWLHPITHDHHSVCVMITSAVLHVKLAVAVQRYIVNGVRVQASSFKNEWVHQL